MNCDEAVMLMSRGLDDGLAEEQRAGLQAHLGACPDCARLAGRMERLEGLLQAGEAPEPEADYWDGLSERVMAGLGMDCPETRQRMWFHRAAAGLMAAAAAALAVGFLVGRWQAVRQGQQEGGRPALAAHDPEARLAAILIRSQSWLNGSSAEQAEAFSALRDYFRSDLKWMVQDGAQTELGVGSNGVAAAASGAERGAVEVDVRIVRVEAGGRTPVVSAPDLMLREGAEAAFELVGRSDEAGRRFRYRCVHRPGGDGAMIMLEVEAAPLDRGMGFRMTAAVPVGGDAQVPAAYARIGASAYALYVRAYPLEATQRGGGAV